MRLLIKMTFVFACSGGVALGQNASRQSRPSLPYSIVDTGQTLFYNDHGAMYHPAKKGMPFYGQDANFDSHAPAYLDHHDGTVSDLNTGLMWVQARGEKTTWQDAGKNAAACRVGGYADWRMPTIKELYSLILFTGKTAIGNPALAKSSGDSVPYLDTRYFRFAYGEPARGERIIDCQDWSATPYISTTMNGQETAFGVNFADGRIKGYPRGRGPRGEPNKLYVRYVRGNMQYGKNDFINNNNGTVTDRATGLMWSHDDSQRSMNWQNALEWAQQQNHKKFAGYDDWRLPNAKELQSIVDYSRAPAVTHSAAIDPVFAISVLADGDYPYFWSSTTHLDGQPEHLGDRAIYVAFGRATGWMSIPPGSPLRLLDVHGAGAQRSDPKSGNPDDFPKGLGPQGDVMRIYNYVRLVRTVNPADIQLRP